MNVYFMSKIETYLPGLNKKKTLPVFPLIKFISEPKNTLTTRDILFVDLNEKF